MTRLLTVLVWLSAGAFIVILAVGCGSVPRPACAAPQEVLVTDYSQGYPQMKVAAVCP